MRDNVLTIVSFSLFLMKKKRTLYAKEENYQRSNDLKIKMENWASYRMAQTQPDSRTTLKRVVFFFIFSLLRNYHARFAADLILHQLVARERF